MDAPKEPASTPPPPKIDWVGYANQYLNEAIAGHHGISNDVRQSHEFRARVAVDALAKIIENVDRRTEELVADALKQPEDIQLIYLAGFVAAQEYAIGDLKRKVHELEWKLSIPPAL